MRFETVFFWINSQVTVRDVTIRAPLDSPNTDGIDLGEISHLGKLRTIFQFPTFMEP